MNESVAEYFVGYNMILYKTAMCSCFLWRVMCCNQWMRMMKLYHSTVSHLNVTSSQIAKTLFRIWPIAGASAAATKLRYYSGEHSKWTENAPGAYDAFYGRYIPRYFTWLVAISTGPQMFLDFLTDGSGTKKGFTVSLNTRPTSMEII